MSFLTTAGAFLVAIAILIVVHEYGHYIVARMCGVRVLKFSVGFGKTLWSRRIGPDQTEWAVSAIPFGGYVKMLDESEGTVSAAEAHRAFNRQSVGRRFAIVAAGPAFNFVLAVLLYWVLYMAGVPEMRPIVGAPDTSSIAARSGFADGDTIRSIDGEPMETWQEVRWQLLQRAVGRKVTDIEVLDQQQQVRHRVLDLSGFDLAGLQGDPLLLIGLRLFRPHMEPVVGRLHDGGVGRAAGLEPGDRVLGVDGTPVQRWDEVVSAIRTRPGKATTLAIERGGVRMEISLVPEAVTQDGARHGRIGASPQVDPARLAAYTIEISYGPFRALVMGVQRTWETSVFSLKMLAKMLVGEVSWKNLSGPVTIADYAGQSAQIGLAAYLSFIALISISLGVLNLLPIPLLDGGHLMYYLVEMFKGSPVPDRIVEMGQRVGLSVLLCMMAFAVYNDINRIISG